MDFANPYAVIDIPLLELLRNMGIGLALAVIWALVISRSTRLVVDHNQYLPMFLLLIPAMIIIITSTHIIFSLIISSSSCSNSNGNIIIIINVIVFILVDAVIELCINYVIIVVDPLETRPAHFCRTVELDPHFF